MAVGATRLRWPIHHLVKVMTLTMVCLAQVGRPYHMTIHMTKQTKNAPDNWCVFCLFGHSGKGAHRASLPYGPVLTKINARKFW
jgi:hypothetical protein